MEASSLRLTGTLKKDEGLSRVVVGDFGQPITAIQVDYKRYHSYIWPDGVSSFNLDSLSLLHLTTQTRLPSESLDSLEDGEFRMISVRSCPSLRSSKSCPEFLPSYTWSDSKIVPSHCTKNHVRKNKTTRKLVDTKTKNLVRTRAERYSLWAGGVGEMSLAQATSPHPQFAYVQRAFLEEGRADQWKISGMAGQMRKAGLMLGRAALLGRPAGLSVVPSKTLATEAKPEDYGFYPDPVEDATGLQKKLLLARLAGDDRSPVLPFLLPCPASLGAWSNMTSQLGQWQGKQTF